MLLLWCSMKKFEGCLLIEFLFSKVSPQGKKTKKTTMSHIKMEQNQHGIEGEIGRRRQRSFVTKLYVVTQYL